MPDASTPARIRVAVQGELGSFSELAAYEFFPERDVAICPCESFVDLFAAVDEGRADFGMAPVENSLAGSIHQVWELLVSRPLPVMGEILLRVSHCLISHPGARLEDIRDVYSHPQALAQCRDFLRSHGHIREHEVYDTAGAVKMIKARERQGDAAIGPAQSASDQGMEILARAIETQEENYTRFLVLSREPASLEGQTPLKTTVVGALADTGRRLPEVLQVLEEQEIGVLKVELRKRLGEPWAYDLYLEFEGGAEGPAALALECMAESCRQLTVIGSYPPGRAAIPRLHQR